MLKFLRVAFGLSGTRTPVPDSADPSGAVSYVEGYGADYQRPKTDPLSKNIERDKMNQILFDVTNAIGELQARGVPDFITSALNGGTPYSYAIRAICRYNDNLYYSLVNGNTALPTDVTKWGLIPLDASTLAFTQAGANAVAQFLQTRDRKWVLDTDFDTIQHAIDYCQGFGADAPALHVSSNYTLSEALIINRPSATPSLSRGKFVIRGMGRNAGFTMTGVKYMFENNIAGTSENIVFENIWFGGDHSDNSGTGYTGVMKAADFIRVTFTECYFQEIGVEPRSATYMQSFYFDHCKFVSWNGPVADAIAFYDLSVIGCQFESGNYPGSRGFSAYDATLAQNTQKATFLSNLYENSTGAFVIIQNGRGVSVIGNYFEAVNDQVLDFQQGSPLGVVVSGNSFDTSGKPATYAPIIIPRINGFFGNGNWSSTRLYTVLNEMGAGPNDQGGSIGIGDRTNSGELLSTSSAAVEVGSRMSGVVQSYRFADENQGISLGFDETFAGVVAESVNKGSATYLPLALRQRNNTGARNLLTGQPDGSVALNILGSGVTLTENLSMGFFQATTTQLRIVVRCSDGVTRTANLTLS